MNDEKQMILEMLKEGKITVEEANSLLDAIGSSKSRPENDFITKLSNSIDNVIKKTTETIGNIDLENIEINQFTIRGDVNTHKEMRIEDEINDIEIDLTSGKVIIERADDNAITLTQDIWSKKADLIDYVDVDITEDSLRISQNADKSIDATTIIKLELAKDIYERVHINMVNGAVEIADVNFNNSEIDTVDCKTTVINSAGNIDINNVNGKIDIKNTDGKLVIDNVNGPIYLSNISGEEASINTVSGSIRADGLKSKSFDGVTVSGNIRLINISESENIDIESASGNIVVDTQNYEGDIRAYVDSQDLIFSEKFKNKIEKDGGYEVSTSLENYKLAINAAAAFGKINIR